MRIWLLRHAHAEARAPSGMDCDRPLSKRGEMECRILASWIAGLEPPWPEIVRVSPALRARQTASLALAGRELPEPEVDDRLWEATTSDLESALADLPDSTRCALLVGHNPGLESLVHRLSGQIRGLSPGGLAILDAIGGLRPGHARLVLVTGPAQISSDSR